MSKKYSTLNQIVKALLKKEELNDKKYQDLQNSIKTITASNVDDVVRDHLSRCLEIKQDISNLSISVNKANTSDAIKELRGKISSIEGKIEEIDINKIKLGIETRDVKTQINSIKEDFQSNIKKFEKELRQKENEINENNLKEAAQKKGSQQKESSSVGLRQSPTKETGAVPKRREERNKKRHQQYLQEQRKKKAEEKKKSKTQVKKIEEFHLLYYQFDSIIRKVKSTMYHNILNIKGIMFKNENMHNKECNEQFSLIINCYVKVYCIGRLVLGGIKVEKNSVSNHEVLQNEFKKLKIEKRFPFEHLLSLFTQKSCGARVKPRILDIEKNFNAIMNILSEYTSFPADLCYAKMPDVKNTDEILDDLLKRTLNRIDVDKIIEENKRYFKTLSDSDVSEIFDGTFDNVFQSYIYEAVKALEEKEQHQSLPSNSIKETSIEPQGACAQAEK